MTVVALAGFVIWCQQLERRFIHAIAPEYIEEKLQGVALQKQAFAQPDLLVVYGSSELVKEMPNNASQFFADYPTGFRVFPVGKPGAASLIVLQKIAAVGRTIRDRKLAYSISPGWFFSETVDPTFYVGNFSPLQALEVAFSTDLSRELKRDIARRMLAFPKTLEEHDMLAFALERLAGDTLVDRAIYGLSRPLGYLSQLVGRTQDHFEAALHILDEDEKLSTESKRGLRALNWNEVLKRAAQFGNATAVQAKKNEVARRKASKVSRAKTFLQAIANAKEWTDIELLMRTCAELGAKPLLLSMPVEDIRLEVYGLAPSARTAYLDRLDGLADRFDFPLLDFREHQADPAFMVDFLDHLSAEGWLYYNKALDDFFHGRISGL
ncbi:MAG: D-alanine transfer protein [Chthoniobacter sp.]|nr:D-alanine transfer protein [Chthoniobacter sp.]